MQASRSTKRSRSLPALANSGVGLSARHLRHVILPSAQVRSASAVSQPRLRQYISEQFARVYGAQVEAFLPQLLSVSCQAHHRAALGVRSAVGDTLFLEQYLPHPVEQILEVASGCDVPRETIAEVGNLVSTRRGASQLLFVITAAALHQAGMQWVVFTATDEVRAMLSKLRYTPLELGVATAASLRSNAGLWGDYYATRPQVLAGDVDAAMAQIQQHEVLRAILSTHRQSIDEVAMQLREQVLSRRSQ